jgi:pimeloyl-ACP methyl ester carboxylesterase
MSDAPTLLLFPGLGADSRVFAPQRLLPFPLQVGEWPEPESCNETLAHYSHRIADAIGPRKNLFVGGVSLGAMVALETARLLNARGVLLIGGCTSGRQISRAFRSVLKSSAAMPTRMIRPTLLLAPAAFLIFERLRRADRRLMTRVLREHSPAQTQWSCRAILDWECCAIPPGAPVYSIHGERDEIIPLRNVRVDQVVPGGKHLINLETAEEVNRFIAEKMRGGNDGVVSPDTEARGAQ